MSVLVFLLSWSVSMLTGMFAGVTLHELSHWAAMKAAGVRGVKLVKPSVSEGRLTAAVSYEGNVTQGVRFGAVAPVITGAGVVAVLVYVQVWEMQPILLAFSVGLLLRTVRLSRADIQTARGRFVPQ